MKKLILLTILIPSIASADWYSEQMAASFAKGFSQPYQQQQPAYVVPVQPQYVPQNNLERQMQNDYLQEITKTQQIKNRALEAEINNPNKGLVVPGNKLFGGSEY